MTVDAGEHARTGAMAMSDLLAFSMTRDPRPNDQLYVWETNALDWIARQREADPDTAMNLWTSRRLDDYLAWRDAPRASPR